jgi:DNA-directed RNA polymerase I subunit RPA2
METCLPRINQYMLTAELSQPPKPADDSGRQVPTYPFSKMSIWFEDIELKKPTRNQSSNVLLDSNSAAAEADKMFPYECRLRSLTYQAPLYATIARKFDNEPEEKVTICLGEVPVMVRSKFCNLEGMDEEELVKHREDCFEFGGYFVINGNEKVCRMLIMNKRNYPVAFQRPTFINRGKQFSTYAVQMRCVREDLFAQTVTVHYLTDGNCMMKFIYHKQEFLIPIYVMLKALGNVTDAQIYNRLVKGYFKNRQLGDQVEVMLSDAQKYCLYSQTQCLAYIGSRFRTVLDGVS